MAEVVPFPISRRRRFIARQAQIAAGMKQEAGERYIQHQLKTQAQTMRRRGIDEEVISRELHCMDTAIRANLFMSMPTPKGRA